MTTYLLRTSAGSTIMSFDTLDAARQAKARKQPEFPKPLVIVAQRITERVIAA